MTRKDLNLLLMAAGLAWFLWRGQSMPMAGTIAGIPVNQ